MTKIRKSFIFFLIVSSLLTISTIVFAFEYADSFDYPLGPPDGTGYACNGLTFLELYDYANSCYPKIPVPEGIFPEYHPGEDWNDDNSGKDFKGDKEDAGDPVYAIANGIVKYADKYSNVTGYIVKIQHTAPPGQNFILPNGSLVSVVWSKYEHLASIDKLIIVNQTVKKNQEIGKVGDFPHGSGKAFHLHFEILYKDRDLIAFVYNTYKNAIDFQPWQKSKVQEFYTNPSAFIDLNHSIAQCRWDFNTTGWDENWTRTRIDDYSVSNGIFSINHGASDPNITSPVIAISAAKSALIICMASNAPDGVGAIYFTTATSPNWDEVKKVDFAIINDGKYHDYFVSMKSNPNWQGTITQIRIDPADEGISHTNVDTIGIDFISLVQLDWNFNNAGDTDGWTMINIEKYSVGNGIFYIDPGALDPYITSPIISKDATAFYSIFIRMASNAPDRVGAIYFTTEKFPNWNENKKVPFSVINDGKYYKYAIHMNSNPNWWGTITGIRIDPANTGISGTGSDTIGIDCIHVY